MNRDQMAPEKTMAGILMTIYKVFTALSLIFPQQVVLNVTIHNAKNLLHGSREAGLREITENPSSETADRRVLDCDKFLSALKSVKKCFKKSARRVHSYYVEWFCFLFSRNELLPSSSESIKASFSSVVSSVSQTSSASATCPIFFLLIGACRYKDPPIKHKNKKAMPPGGAC